MNGKIFVTDFFIPWFLTGFFFSYPVFCGILWVFLLFRLVIFDYIKLNWWEIFGSIFFIVKFWSIRVNRGKELVSVVFSMRERIWWNSLGWFFAKRSELTDSLFVLRVSVNCFQLSHKLKFLIFLETSQLRWFYPSEIGKGEKKFQKSSKIAQKWDEIGIFTFNSTENSS